MPELPEVETVARDLAGLVLGASITAVRCTWPRTLRDGDPDAFAAAVIGRRIEAVGRRGKQVVVELSDGTVVTIHLKMTGQLFVVAADQPVDPYVRLVLDLDDGRQIRFRDIRKFGRVGVHAGTDEGSLAGYGPEPLDPALTLRLFRARLRSRRGRLKPLLLDQGFLAGIGNIYADEALWRSRLHPLRTVGTLRPEGERRLYRAIREVLAEAVALRGSSIDDYTAPGGDGAMQERLQVYQRAGEDCRRCGRPIRRIVVGARATHFCSWCQRLPAADRAAAGPLLAVVRRPARIGRRWTDLAGPASLGLTAGEAARAVQRERAARTRQAAATRRAAARG